MATGEYCEPHPGAGPLRVQYQWAHAESVALGSPAAFSSR
jgi:hypothetical protein